MDVAAITIPQPASPARPRMVDATGNSRQGGRNRGYPHASRHSSPGDDSDGNNAHGASDNEGDDNSSAQGGTRSSNTTVYGADKWRWEDDKVQVLLEGLLKDFRMRGSNDRVFKQPAFEAVAAEITKKFGVLVSFSQCKNKWSTIRGKWVEWCALNSLGAHNFDPERELFTLPRDQWDQLREHYPNIFWHRTHPLPFRNILSQISDILPVVDLKQPAQLQTPRSSTLPTPAPFPPTYPHAPTSSKRGAEDSQAAYKRARVETHVPLEASNYHRQQPHSQPTSAEPITAISEERMDSGQRFAFEQTRLALDRELLAVEKQKLAFEQERLRKQGEMVPTVFQRAVSLLEKAYHHRLSQSDFAAGLKFLQTPVNSETFLALSSISIRDTWLESALHVQLIPEVFHHNPKAFEHAVPIMERDYADRMTQKQYNETLKFLEDGNNANVFMNLQPQARRDRWLERTMRIQLRPLER